MTETVSVALISAGSSALVAITALILNYRGFASIDARFAALENSVNGRFASIENRITNLENRIDRRLEAIEADLKEFFRMLAELDKRMSRLEEKQ
jgi:hypothetical protein